MRTCTPLLGAVSCCEAELPVCAWATSLTHGHAGWSRRSDLKPQALNSKVCAAMPKDSQAGAVSKKEEWMGLVSCPSHVFLNQLDTPIPAHGSQYLWWAWEEKASSYSSASRHGHAVSSVYSSQYLKTARKSCNLFKELLTLDDLALGGFPRVMAFSNICFILRRSSHLPLSTAAELTKDWLEIGLFVLLFFFYQELFSRSPICMLVVHAPIFCFLSNKTLKLWLSWSVCVSHWKFGPQQSQMCRHHFHSFRKINFIFALSTLSIHVVLSCM